MKYKRLEEAEHKQQDREDRKRMQFKLYTECNTMEEFMMKTVLDGVKLTFLEKAAFWTYYIANNYGSHSNTAVRLCLYTAAVLFLPLWMMTPSAVGHEYIFKFFCVSIGSIVASAPIVGALCMFMKHMERQENDAARNLMYAKAMY